MVVVNEQINRLIWGTVWWVGIALGCVMVFSKPTNSLDYWWASLLLFLALVAIQLKWRCLPPWDDDRRGGRQAPDQAQADVT